MKSFLFYLLMIAAQIITAQGTTINIKNGGGDLTIPNLCDNSTIQIVFNHENGRYRNFVWTARYNGISMTFEPIIGQNNASYTFSNQPTLLATYQVLAEDTQTGNTITGPAVNIIVTPSNNEDFHITMGESDEIAPDQITICQGDSIELSTNKKAANTYWNGELLQTTFINESQIIITEVPAEINGCSVFDTIQVDVIEPTVDILLSSANKTKFCSGDSVVLTASSNIQDAKYLWSNGATAPAIVVKESSTHQITANTQQGGCYSTNEITVDVIEPAVSIFILENKREICDGESLTLTVDANFSPQNISWLPEKSTESVLTVNESGEYRLDASKDNYCKGSDLVNITVYPAPVTIPNELEEIETLPYNLDAANFIDTDPTTYSYSWRNNEVSTLSNQQKLTLTTLNTFEGGDTQLSLEVVNTSTNCSTVISHTVRYSPKEKVSEIQFVPNVFKPDEPNEDNNSLRFYGENISPENFSFEIYNRWGQIVYATSSLDEAQNTGWLGSKDNSGDLLQGGTYTYKISGTYTNASPFDKIGSATMIR